MRPHQQVVASTQHFMDERHGRPPSKHVDVGRYITRATGELGQSMAARVDELLLHRLPQGMSSVRGNTEHVHDLEARATVLCKLRRPNQGGMHRRSCINIDQDTLEHDFIRSVQCRCACDSRLREGE